MAEGQMQTLSLKAAYAFGIAHGLEKETAEIRDLVVEWDRTDVSRLRRGYFVELFQKHGLFEQFKKEHWHVGDTPVGERKAQRYLRVKAKYDDFLAGKGSEGEESGVESEDELEEQQFAAEADLRDFLAQNPGCIEKGLQLYRAGEKRGVEFAIDGGFIDLLVMDKNKKGVVVELKLGRGRNKALGQLLYYMGWVDAHIPELAPCRGMIIAKEISEELQLAVKRVPGVLLMKYNLSVTVEPVVESAK